MPVSSSVGFRTNEQHHFIFLYICTKFRPVTATVSGTALKRLNFLKFQLGDHKC